jgi:hypothetical protein
MPARELTAEMTAQGRVRFKLRLEGPVSEADVAAELTAILQTADPALESDTGRLVPGKRNGEIRTNLFLTAPDAHGNSHLGGIECHAAEADLVVSLAEARGYRVQRAV